MSVQRLRYVSTAVLSDLRQNVEGNVARYTSDGFDDLTGAGGWDIELRLRADLSPLADLEPTSAADAENSIKVWRALHELTPSLAREERFWVRLSHVECLPYTRQRWLYGKDGEDLKSAINIHCFADTRTKCRDDHSISRLWWTAYIAKLAAPDDHEYAIRKIFKTTDVRSNFVERALIVNRPSISSGIVRLMHRTPQVIETADNFRDFMKKLNILGSGVLFEVKTDEQIDRFMDACVLSALGERLKDSTVSGS